MTVFNAGSIEATLDLDLDPFQRGLAEARADGKRFVGETFTAKFDADTTLAARGANNARRSLEQAEGTYHARFEVDGLAEAAAEAAGLQAALSGAAGDRTLGVNTKGAQRNIDGVKRGLRGLIPLLAIASTGLIPLSAAAVPVLGLANNLTLAVAAGGSVVLAAQGIGEAFKAANAAGAEPTAENLEKMRASMSKLSPEAREFVDLVRGMSADARDLQQTAAQGFFFPVNNQLEHLDLGQFRGLVAELSSVAGEQLGHALDALDDPRWRQFFRFLKGEARPGVDALGDSVGNLAGFFASLWQAFDPLNDDFSDWLVDSTGRLRAWADALPDDPAFADFIAYVREQGPEVAETLGAVGGAFVDVIQAAAPLGGVVLDVLQAVAEAVSAIADAPFGGTLLEGAAALYTLNKALAITEGLMTRTGLMAGAGAAGGAAKGAKPGTALGGFLTPIPGKVSSSWRGFAADAKVVGRTTWDAGIGIAKTTEAAERMGQRLRTAGKGAAVLAGVGLVASGVSDKLGLTQTATLAMMGAMVGGVPGAIAGGAVGAMMDLTSAGKDLMEQQRQLSQQVRETNSDFAAGQAAMFASQKVAADFHDSLSVAGNVAEGWRIVTGQTTLGEQVGRQAQADSATFHANQDAATAIGGALGADFHDQFGRDMLPTMQQLTTYANRAAPAMNALSISWSDLTHMSPDALADAADQIAEWTRNADSAKGRTDAFGASVHDLANDALSTSDSAAQLSDALEALLSPQLDLESATDAWRVSLRGLEKDLKEGYGFKGYSKQAIANRQVTRDYTEDAMSRLKALAGVSTTTEGDMARAVSATRQEFIRSGIAAGISREAIVKRANAMGLTPKMVKTVFEAAGVTQADLRARRLATLYKGMPKDVRTAIKADGIPKTVADVNKLVEKYDLTDKQRTALLTIRDLASKGVSNVLAKLTDLDRRTASPSVILDTSRFFGAVSNVWSSLEHMAGKVVTTYVDTVHRNKHAAGGAVFSGAVHGPGGPTDDRVPALLSNGEHVWTAREVAAAGGHAAVEALRYAVTAQGAPRVTLSRGHAAAAARAMPSTGAGFRPEDVDRIIRAIEQNRGVYAHVSSREDLEHAARALDAELRRGAA